MVRNAQNVAVAIKVKISILVIVNQWIVEDAVASTPTNEKRDRWSSTYLANGGLQRAATRTNSLAYSPSRSLVKSTDQSTPAKELITKPISEVIEPVSDLPLCYLCDDPIKQVIFLSYFH